MKTNKHKKLLNEMMSNIPTTNNGQNIDNQLLRIGILSELDAINLYEQLADLATDETIKILFLDIAKEEKTHVGEFEGRLKDLDKETEEELKDGDKEQEDMNEIKKINITESELISLVKKVIIKEYTDYRPGSIGVHSRGEASIAGIPATNDLNYTDKGRSTPEQRMKWAQMKRRPNNEYYPNGLEKHLQSHMRHLQALYGNKIEFFGYDNGRYIFYDYNGQKGFLLPGSLNSEYK